MPELNANIARYYFEGAALPPEVFQVARFKGVEELSRLFYFEIELVSSDPFVDFAQVVNQAATLTLMRNDEPTYISGLVIDLQQEGRTPDYVSYRAILAPRVWWLTLSFQSRIFQHKTIQEIITQVLGDAGLPASAYRFELSANDPREYVVQYNESDWDFISRLMEHEGIFCFFEHGADGETFVVADDQGAFPTMSGESTIVYRQPGGMVTQATEVVDVFRCREQIVTGKVVLKDYNYRTPDVDLSVESQLNGDMPGLYYEYGDHHGDVGTGNRLAQVRNEEIECRRRVLSGRSDCTGFRTANVFSLEEHYRPDLDADYLFTRIEHQGAQWRALGLVSPGATDDPGADMMYQNTFTCIPASVAFRPERRTLVPNFPGIMTAQVETAGGDYAHIDDEGRYHVKMYFDRSSVTDGTATRPVRMAQPYAGPDYGMHFPLHVGTEVAVVCVNGNVDRPIIMGAVPNPNTISPSTSSNKPQNVIRTWGKNELTFDDKIGEENIYMFATKDHTVEVTNDETIVVGNDQSILIGHDRAKRVENDQSESIGNDKSIDVKVNHSETIGSEKTLSVGGNHNEDIGKNMTITVDQNLTEKVTLNYDESVGKNMQLSIGVNLTTSVGSNSNESVGDNKTVRVGKDLTETVDKEKTVSVGKDLKEKIGGDHHEEVTKEFAVNAKKIQLMAEEQIVLKTGKAEIIMKKNGDIIIKGKKIQIKGSGDVVIKGKKIKEN